MSLERWDLAWAGLDPSVGHEQAGRRPVLVFCNGAIGRAIGLVSVLPLSTWREGRKVYPTEVLVPEAGSSLPFRSLVLCHQVRTIAAQRLSPPFGSIDDLELRKAIERAVALWLGIGATSN